MKRIIPLLPLLWVGCVADQSVDSTPTRVAIVFITATPALAVSGSPSDEPLPFRDLTTLTQTASPLPTNPSPLAVTSIPTLAPAQSILPIPTALATLVAPTAPILIAPSPTPVLVAPTTLPIQPVADIASAEQAIIDLTNFYRAQSGLPPLARDESIMSIARSRSADMVARNFFDHTDPITGAVLAKPQVLALGYGRAGENIYMSGRDDLAAFPVIVVNWFMGDAPHRANLLNSGYTAVGVGLAWNGLGWNSDSELWRAVGMNTDRWLPAFSNLLVTTQPHPLAPSPVRKEGTEEGETCTGLLPSPNDAFDFYRQERGRG